VHLTITDDGRGFDLAVAQAPGREHFGLPGLRARARTIGATLEINTRPGAGTRIAVRIPASDHARNATNPASCPPLR